MGKYTNCIYVNNKPEPIREISFEKLIPKKIIKSKPNLNFNPSTRRGRNTSIYIASKYHVSDLKIKGPVISLSANRPIETSKLFEPFVKGLFLNVEKHKPTFEALKKWYPILSKEYGDKKDGIYHSLEEGELLDVMEKYENMFSIIDMDECSGAKQVNFKRQAEAINKCSTNLCTLLWAHMVGRHCGTDKEYRLTYRPKMVRELKKYYFIRKHTKIKYKDNIPMRLEIFTLERKYFK